MNLTRPSGHRFTFWRKFTIGFACTGVFLAPVMLPPAHAAAPSYAYSCSDIPPPTIWEWSSRHDCVRNAQEQLNWALAANLNVDGVFGPKTLGAVKAFQWDERIKVDGIIGPVTWDRLNYCFWHAKGSC